MKVIQPVDTTGYAPFTRASTGTYFDQDGVMYTAPIDTVRFNWNPETGVYEGALVEPTRENLAKFSATGTTQSVTISPTGIQHTLSFWGTGTINLSAGGSPVAIVGSGRYPVGFPDPDSHRTTYTFTPTISPAVLTISGTVTKLQVERGSYATSYIATTAATVTRAADVVTGTGLFASSMGDTVPVWDVGTTYNVGDTITVAPRFYISLTNGNLGNAPPTYPTLSNAYWSDTGPNNTFAMFDRQVSTPTVGTANQEVFAFKIGSDGDALALMDIVGATEVIAIISNGVATTDPTTDPNNPPDPTYTTQTVTGSTNSVIMTGFTPGTIITVFVRSNPSPSIGEVVCGELHTLGNTQYGMSAKIADYSIKETDEFGVTTFVERPFSKRLTAEVMVDKADFNSVFTLLSELRASPSVWIASDNLDYSDGAVVYGYYRDFTMQVAYFDASLCSIEIEGLI